MIDDIIAECKTWIGTPFKYGCTEKHKGTDCIRWLLCVLKKFNIIAQGYKPKHLPPDWIYFPDYDQHAFRKEILRFCDQIEWDDKRKGDIVTFVYGPYERECHIGIIVDDEKFIHAMQRRKVKEQRLRNYPNFCSLYRIRALIDG